MDAFYKALARNKSDADECKDCRDLKKPPAKEVRVNHPVLGQIFCVPHRGELDDDWNPIDSKGNLYKPGIRICGKKDCVHRDHVIAPDVETPASSKVLTGATDERGQ
jgi:hypothetical protein